MFIYLTKNAKIVILFVEKIIILIEYLDFEGIF